MDERIKIKRYLYISLVLTAFVFCVSIVFGGFTLASARLYKTITQQTPDVSVAVSDPGLQAAQQAQTPTTDTGASPVTSETHSISGGMDWTSTPQSEVAASTQVIPYADPTSTPTESALPTDTPDPNPTVTATQTTEIISGPPTINPTSQAMPMFVYVEQLFKQKVVSTTQGKYYAIEDFESNWADTSTYQKTYTGFESTDFVLRANLTWQVVNPDLGKDSGCGIIFHENEAGEYFLLVFTLDGRAILYKRIEGILVNLGTSFRYDVDRELAQARVTVTVENNRIRIIVAGKELFNNQYYTLETGKLAFTVISGSSLDYGTRCEMHKIELWEIER